MEDTWSPAPTQPGTYWSLEQCCWVAAPVEVTVPGQREDEPAEEPVRA